VGLTTIVASIGQFYSALIIVYVLMSWFPVSGVFEEIHRALGAIVEPYLGLFRRIIPPIGMVDISPIVALLVLQWVIVPLLRSLVGGF
jgi:YggT family protein